MKNPEKAKRMGLFEYTSPNYPPKLDERLPEELSNRDVNPSVKSLGKPKRVKVAGRSCLEYHFSYHPLTARPFKNGRMVGPIEVDKRVKYEAWHAIYRGVVMRNVTRAHRPAPPRPELTWSEMRKEVVSLDLSPKFTSSVFAPPPGAIFKLHSSVPIKPPVGAVVERLDSDGFSEGGPKPARPPE